MALLEALKGLGAISMEALARHLARDYSKVRTDTTKLLDLGLVEETPEGLVWVPWEEVQIRVTLGSAKAA